MSDRSPFGVLDCPWWFLEQPRDQKRCGCRAKHRQVVEQPRKTVGEDTLRLECERGDLLCQRVYRRAPTTRTQRFGTEEHDSHSEERSI